ncbi:MAG TPA: carbamoyltransferase C-terminal domain-containing protein [Melioribacteraceae bacterium]|nr:carbamoyltransferase C-terminal domain-containing protein [Melioribacteraceae bacterium]
MVVLGVHVGHDSSAALVIDGKLVADVAEERFKRIKHYNGLPLKSIDYCLKSQNITINEVDIIAVPGIHTIPDFNFLFELGLPVTPDSRIRNLLEIAPVVPRKTLKKPPIYVKSFKKNDRTKIVNVEHHLAHAASAYYTSGDRKKQLIVTMDGAGDKVSTCIWKGEDGKIVPLKKFDTKGSLGWFYSNVTEALGWWHGDGEGKTMGLAPYGDYQKVKGLLDKFYPKFGTGDLIEPYDYGRAFIWNEGGQTEWHFDDAFEIKKLVDKHGAENIAAEAQRVLEEQAFEIIFPWMEKEKTKNLTCAGGVFLNVKLNQRLWETGKIEKQIIFPNAGDSGLASGAALYAYYSQNPEAEIYSLTDLYLGPEYSENEIEDVLKLRNLKYRKLDNATEYAAKKLAEDKIICWFQGRMESGPRALGNRSILMSANKAENKNIINARVKFREAFRPFCPSISWEKKEDYLERERDEYFMITSFTCKEDKRKNVPAVVHADHTLRPQTIKKNHNPKYWRLINDFGNMTGEYLILNTSMNIMGEPIINHPREAIRCFYDNGLDVLIMNDFVLEK